MKFIIDGKFGLDHRPYWEYLSSIESRMPAHLFAFASNPEHHDLESPNSLHDSWLEYWSISETKNEGRSDRSACIDACFLGPRHDRYIYLRYKNVEKHGVHGAGELTSPPRQTSHGDLLVHEMTIVREGLFSHELVFSKGAVFSVEFADFDHCVEIINKP
jgi:hypothetical protein